MKPTQKEIIELAREQGLYLDGINTQLPLYVLKQEELVSLVHLALERFGAGGGEPVAYDKTALNAFAQDLYNRKMREGKHGHYESMYHVIHQCIARTHTHPSPTDLRAEYLRGLEDAASIVENADTPDCGGWTTCGIAEEIRALKAKQ